MESLFESKSYRPYLSDRLGGGARLGLKKKAAEALSVHTTYISQVLSGTSDLSLEQAECMNDFLGHTDAEGDYFIGLVLYERAGTKSLKKRIARSLEEQKSKRLNLSERIVRKNPITDADRERFYGTYLHAAIHVLSSIPVFQTREVLASILGTPLKRVNQAVEFLIELGVLTETLGRLQPGIQHVHLESSSSLISKHHTNWRLKAIERINESPARDLHYSVAVSLSESDVTRIKEILLRQLSEFSGIVSESPEETAYVFCFDFFELVN